jgi:hypothetical protein
MAVISFAPESGPSPSPTRERIPGMSEMGGKRTQFGPQLTSQLRDRRLSDAGEELSSVEASASSTSSAEDQLCKALPDSCAYSGSDGEVDVAVVRERASPTNDSQPLLKCRLVDHVFGTKACVL